MELIKSFDHIGYQGPIITSLITCISLLGKPIYLSMFIVGSFLNYCYPKLTNCVIGGNKNYFLGKNKLPNGLN